VIEELRKARYASIDKMTEEALKKQVLKNWFFCDLIIIIWHIIKL
jgi:hypothetical protein